MTRAHFVTLAVAGLVASTVGLACDRKWDFECTAVWEARDGTELSRERSAVDGTRRHLV